MRHDTQRVQRAYDQVLAEFAGEQNTTKNGMGASSILADLNEYERRCNIIPISCEESDLHFL